jgi:hypothetical protein
MIALLVHYVFLHALAQDTDVCKCYCCPSAVNPHGVIKSCNVTSPPLAGSVAIGLAGEALCNRVSCNTYFADQCPPKGHFYDSGAASKAGCKTCPDGEFGNQSVNQTPEVGKDLNNYDNQGGNLNHAHRTSKKMLSVIFMFLNI